MTPVSAKTLRRDAAPLGAYAAASVSQFASFEADA
jgi:hypothetical protein